MRKMQVHGDAPMGMPMGMMAKSAPANVSRVEILRALNPKPGMPTLRRMNPKIPALKA